MRGAMRERVSAKRQAGRGEGGGRREEGGMEERKGLQRVMDEWSGSGR